MHSLKPKKSSGYDEITTKHTSHRKYS